MREELQKVFFRNYKYGYIHDLEIAQLQKEN